MGYKIHTCKLEMYILTQSVVEQMIIILLLLGIALIDRISFFFILSGHKHGQPRLK